METTINRIKGTIHREMIFFRLIMPQASFYEEISIVAPPLATC